MTMTDRISVNDLLLLFSSVETAVVGGEGGGDEGRRGWAGPG